MRAFYFNLPTGGQLLPLLKIKVAIKWHLEVRKWEELASSWFLLISSYEADLPMILNNENNLHQKELSLSLMDLGCSIAEEMQKSPLWGRVLSTLWFVEKLLIIVAIDVSLSMSRDCIYYEHCFCHCEVCLAKARWLLSLVQQNPITLINKKFPNHPVCNFRKTKLPISWYKSRKLLNSYHSQADQFALGQYGYWLVQVCRRKRYNEWEKSKCKLLVQKLATRKV